MDVKKSGISTDLSEIALYTLLYIYTVHYVGRQKLPAHMDYAVPLRLGDL